MSTVPRSVKVLVPVIAIAAGVFLLVGNSRNTREHTIYMEQSRLEVLARSWETQINLTQSMLRDQLVRQGLLPALDRPQEWTSPRVQFKLDQMLKTWGKEAGIPQAVALLWPNGTIHTCSGDSNRLRAAVQALAKPTSGEIVLLPRSPGTPEMLALHFRTPETEPGQLPGHAVAVITLAGFLSGIQEAPSGWVMLAAPGKPLIISRNSPTRTPVNDATWPLLLAQGNGNIPLQDGTTLCFSRVQVPAMEPLLLVLPIAPFSSAARFLGWILFVAGLGALIWLPWRSPKTHVPRSAPARSAAATPEDTAVFRQVFHTLDDPVCLLNAAGQVVRANTSAHRWFHFHKGYPKQDLTVWRNGSDRRLSEILALAAADPQEVSGEFTVNVDGKDIEGTLQTTRLEGPHDGIVALHFRIHPSRDPVSVPTESAPSPEIPDPCCPYPVLAVTEDGLIAGFNEAARRVCPRLDDSPLLPDILPALGQHDRLKLSEVPNGHTFESLFGPRLHRFEVVQRDGQFYLYGYPLAASKNLEIALEQAQENFYTLCALSTMPVLLADPRDHTLIEVNAAAADLFQTTPSSLRGRALANLSTEPWELSKESTVFLAQASNGTTTHCELHYELIKIEGAPTLLIVLEPQPEPLLPDYSRIVLTDAAPNKAPETLSAPPPLPLGPGLLVCLSPTVRETARRMLEKTGHECESFSSLDDVTVWLITHDVRPELITIDLTDYDEAGSWIEELRARCGEVPCLAFTDGERYPLPDGGLNMFLEKPFDFESLSAALAQLQLEHTLCPATA